jgi:hypothetical protein
MFMENPLASITLSLAVPLLMPTGTLKATQPAR